MTRTVLALVVLLGCATGARAETLPLFDGVPATYTPGTPFQFTVRVPALSDFTRFSVDLIFGTDVPFPPLLVSAQPVAVAPAGRYVFPSNGAFQFTFARDPGSQEAVLTFSDSSGSPVLTQPAANDTLAVITVTPGAALTGPITLAVGGDSRFDRNLEDEDTLPELITIRRDGGDDGGDPNPVPAPAGAVLFGLGGLLLGARNRLLRSAR